MKQQRSSSNLIVIAIILGPACDGLDPDAFAPSAPARQMGGQAGYHYGAGTGGAGGGGGGGRGSGGTGGTNASIANRAGTTSGGEGGAGTAEPHSDAGSATVGDGGGGVGVTAGHGGGPMEGSGGDSGARGGAASVTGGSSGAGGSAGAMDSTAGGRAAGGLAGNGSAGSDPGVGGMAGTSAADGGSTANGGSAGAGPVARSLSLGEYVEGSGSYKAIELHAVDASTLDGCRLVTYSNGSSTGSGISLTGTVPALGTYTLCSSSLAALLGDACDRTTSLSFNGNDAVVLECDGALVDVFGQIGFDPGSGWIGVNASTLNMTLRRRCDAEGLDSDGTDTFDPDAGWLPLPTDTFDGLGDPTCG